MCAAQHSQSVKATVTGQQAVFSVFLDHSQGTDQAVAVNGRGKFSDAQVVFFKAWLQARGLDQFDGDIQDVQLCLLLAGIVAQGCNTGKGRV